MEHQRRADCSGFCLQTRFKQRESYRDCHLWCRLSLEQHDFALRFGQNIHFDRTLVTGGLSKPPKIAGSNPADPAFFSPCFRALRSCTFKEAIAPFRVLCRGLFSKLTMSDVLWWREESWWERKSLPLLGFNLAPRQILALGSTGLLGFVLSSTLLGDSLFGRIGVFLFFLSIGFVFATKRVKMTPVELQLYYRFVRRKGVLGSASKSSRKNVGAGEPIPKT